jgi:hypothetical protein
MVRLCRVALLAISCAVDSCWAWAASFSSEMSFRRASWVADAAFCSFSKPTLAASWAA